MLSRWQGDLGALVVTLAACGLVILDLADDGLRRWWAEHARTSRAFLEQAQPWAASWSARSPPPGRRPRRLRARPAG